MTVFYIIDSYKEKLIKKNPVFQIKWIKKTKRVSYNFEIWKSDNKKKIFCSRKWINKNSRNKLYYVYFSKMLCLSKIKYAKS